RRRERHACGRRQPARERAAYRCGPRRRLAARLHARAGRLSAARAAAGEVLAAGRPRRQRVRRSKSRLHVSADRSLCGGRLARRGPVMTVPLVVTLNGVDRPGVVARVSECARECGASWQESRFAHLAGRFAGVVRLDVPEESVGALERALRGLDVEGLHVTVERGEAAAPVALPRLTLELVGQDRPGIVRDVSAVLARHGVNIEELETEVESASMSAELLFRARASLVLPESADVDALREDLERLADELMVDVQVDTGEPGDERGSAA